MKKIYIYKIVYALFITLVFSGCDEQKEYVVNEAIYVNYSSLNLFYGDKHLLTVSPVSGSYEWSSEDNNIAIVSKDGEIEAKGVGSTNIIVTNGSVKKSIPVTVSIPEIDKVTGRPGKKRAQIEMNIQSNLIKTARIIRLDTEEFIDMDINFESGVFTTYYTDLEEAMYPFRIISIDKFGKESIPTDIDIQVYGDIYQNKINSRPTKVITAFGNGLAIGWGDPIGTFVDLSYTDINGKEITQRADAKAVSTYLLNYQSITPFRYVTGYLPEAVAVDTFYTETLIVPAEKIQSKRAILTYSKETIIKAGDFDLGGEGIGFHDSNDKNDAGNYAYRENLGDYNSRGCDIESGGNIGYTNPDEWLIYTVYVEDPGVYAVDFHVSVNGSPAQCHIEVDNDKLPVCNMINNNNWSDFRYYCEHNSIAPPTYKLSKGQHKIKFYFDTGSFNFNGLKIYHKADN